MRAFKYQKLITSIRDRTSLFKAFEDGYTPDDIKQGVIDIFSPYITDKEILSRIAVNELMGDAVEHANISKRTWSRSLFEYSFQVHQQAKTANPFESAKAVSEWAQPIYEGLSILWSQLHLEKNLAELDLEEYTYESLRYLGSTIEGIIKPVAMELLQQSKIARGEKTTFQNIRDLELGKVFGELHDQSPDPSFFAPKGTVLSQWRNIAQHYSFRLDSSIIVCSYGRQPNIREIRLSRDELFDVVKEGVDTFSCLRLAYRLYFFDTIKFLHDNNLLPKNPTIRSEARAMNFVSALASQGFEVTEFDDNQLNAKLVLRDVTKMDPNQRRLHTVQFAGLLWQLTHSDVVTVEYLEKDETPCFRTRATRELFERIERENLAPSTLAEEAEITDLRAKV
jgi:hypothetical protein